MSFTPQYHQDELQIDGVAVTELAKVYGTPFYVYSAASIDQTCEQLMTHHQSSPPILPCYAVKANSNLSILRRIRAHGFGADVVSMGELERALRADFQPERIVYSGVGKTPAEMERALTAGILAFNVESPFELLMLAEVAQRLRIKAPVSMRVNPNIDARTHPKISTGLHSTKFGMSEVVVREQMLQFQHHPWLQFVGISCHIGSQILTLEPLLAATDAMRQLFIQLRGQGFPLRLLDLGGGLGVGYQGEAAPTPKDWVDAVLQQVRTIPNCQVILEPGRCVVAESGLLITKVLGLKVTGQHEFVIVDAAMTELLRPSLYDAYHPIGPVKRESGAAQRQMDVVGPVCETGDFLALSRALALPKAGDFLYIACAGAYGMSMSSNYNSRPSVPEVLVVDGNHQLIRRRQELSDLWRLEE
jgi:diaminopimelate decarboxylase